ncbi:unnamed protein product [Albugo candida]|uniref:PRELI/MSF1 domain-containing protein n=1 Tax=Albugo candida TaxID=65357 RepID=A0A024GSQ2_9STRA|nr:unnamed protein product [Albugo candida]|eukprot:CCI49383.1 unnamed protein product [Albugo candida]
MVSTNITEHAYPFSWDVVTRAFWNKYSNPRLSHVERVDVLDRVLDEQGRLCMCRLAKCTQNNIPNWAKNLIGGSTSYVYEESICDPRTKRLKLKSTNLSFRSVATIEETCVYSVHPNNSQQTLYRAEAKVSAFIPFISSKLERFSVRSGSETAADSIRAIENICNDIFEGTFAPAMCEKMSNTGSGRHNMHVNETGNAFI